MEPVARIPIDADCRGEETAHRPSAASRPAGGSQGSGGRSGKSIT